MSVAIADLIQPKGELEIGLFPGDDDDAFTARVTVYLEDAVARVADLVILAADVDAATRAWVYHRAYKQIGTRLLAIQRQASIEGQGSMQFEQKQADGFLAMAQRWLDEFNELVPIESAPPPASVPSASLASTYQW